MVWSNKTPLFVFLSRTLLLYRRTCVWSPTSCIWFPILHFHATVLKFRPEPFTSADRSRRYQNAPLRWKLASLNIQNLVFNLQTHCGEDLAERKLSHWKQVLHFMNTDSKAQRSCHLLQKWFLRPRTGSHGNPSGTGKNYHLIKQKIYHSEQHCWAVTITGICRQPAGRRCIWTETFSLDWFGGLSFALLVLFQVFLIH